MIIKITTQKLVIPETELYINIITITGYTKCGISKQQLIKWAARKGAFVIKPSPVIFSVYTEKPGMESSRL